MNTLELTPAPAAIHAQPLTGAHMPLVITPAEEPFETFSWLQAHREWIEPQLWHYGSLLFRGFQIDTAARFQQFTHSISSQFPEFPEESSPRSRVRDQVMTSTDYPPEYPIQFHNEYSYSGVWPMKLYFGCLHPAATGGETPIASSRNVLKRLSSTVRSKFATHGVLYRRNYSEGIGVSWQTAFQSADKAKVESLCRERSIQFNWGPGGRLTTNQVKPAILRHPETGEDTWFNHAFFFNVRALEPQSLREFMLEEPEDELSTNTYYGDGSPIEESVIEELRSAYEAETVLFSWQQGDVLLLDNMLVAHARSPYTGKRQVVVSMADAHLEER